MRARAVSVHLLDSLAVRGLTSMVRGSSMPEAARFSWLPVALAGPSSRSISSTAIKEVPRFLNRRSRKPAPGTRKSRVATALKRIARLAPYDCILSRALRGPRRYSFALTGHLLRHRARHRGDEGRPPLRGNRAHSFGFRVQQVHALSVPGWARNGHLVLVERA